MPTIELPFASQEGKSSVAQNSQEMLVNMFAEVELSGVRKLMRRQRSGLRAIAAQTGEKRCIERFGIHHYCVIDDKFYRFDGTTLTLLATIGSVTGRCTMIFDDNGNILISDGQRAYYWNGSTITTMAFPTPVGPLTFQGGYGIYTVPGEGQFYITDVNALNTVDPLNFATAESNPDPLVRAFVDHNELWLFGTRSTEIWQLTGGTDFPFTPFSNAQMARGCGAAYSVAAEDNTLFFLGDDWIVYRCDGYRPQRVSTHPIERAIADIPESVRVLADAYVYTQGGHKFYTLRFPGYLTIQYNVATGFWNRASTYLHDDWRILGSAGLAGDYVLTDAGVSQLDDGINQDEGGIMQRGGRAAPIYVEGKRVIVRWFRLECEVGGAPIGLEPQVMLRIARNGETFGNERWRSLGLTGLRKRRAIWRNLGQGEKPTVDISFTDNARFAIMGSTGNLVVGN